jgi:hypothetical protein
MGVKFDPDPGTPEKRLLELLRQFSAFSGVTDSNLPMDEFARYANKLPAPVVPAIAANPILTFLGLLGASSSLNKGEDEWLKQRDIETPPVYKK